MLGWMDDEALRRTLTTGRVMFWSGRVRSTGARATRPGTPSSPGASRSTATATRCSSRSTRSGRPATRATRTCFEPASPRGRGPSSGSAPGTESAEWRTCQRPRRRPRPRQRRQPVGVPHADLPWGETWPTPATSSASSRLATVGSSRSSAGCSPTPRPRSACTASSPRTRPGTFLLESAEHGGVWSRYSFVGARSARHPDRARRRGVLDRRRRRSACPTGGDPLDVLRAHARRRCAPRDRRACRR